mmetsp:Transcript_15038/g.37883  ORF Transcript_15038/g.37883 Transcript_15038/m.37883 type:complete len:385 (-) Transcript_15038:387-1541(-)
MGNKLGIAGNVGQIRGNLLLRVAIAKGGVGSYVKGNVHVNISILPQILVLPPPRSLGNGDKNGGKGNHQTQDGTKNLAATLLLHGNLLPGLVLLVSADTHIVAFVVKFIVLPDCAQVGKTSGGWLHALGLHVVLEGKSLLEDARLVLGISHAARDLVGNPTHLVARLAGGSHDHILGTRSRRLGRLRVALVEAIQNGVGIVRIPGTPARLDLAGEISLKAHAVEDTGRLVVLVVDGGSNNIVLFFRQIIVVAEFGIRKGITVGLPVDAFRRKRLVESKPAKSRGRSARVAGRALELGNRRGAKATRLGSSHGKGLLVAHLFVGHGQNLDGFGSGGRRNGRATGSSFHGWGGRNSSSVGVLGNQIVRVVGAALGKRIRAAGFLKT